MRELGTVHLGKIHFGNGSLKAAGHSFQKYMTFRGLQTLCNGQETPTQWKSESATNEPTNEPG